LDFSLSLKLLSGFTFLAYGTLCLFSRKMVFEFERYRLTKFRVLIGFLEVAGALGQLIGFWIPLLGTAASGGLALLMICGLWARWRIQDPFSASLPALIYIFINSYLVWLDL